MPSPVKLSGPSAELLRQLTVSRLAEVRALQVAGHPAAAWYLGGYILEFALKAVVCRTLGLSHYPESAFSGKAKTHDVTDLVLLAGLTSALEARRREPSFEQNWLLVLEWSPQDRYQASSTDKDVRELLDGYTDAESGVLTWLLEQW